jgi:hypothetical protein
MRYIYYWCQDVDKDDIDMISSVAIRFPDDRHSGAYF